jgi:hypothetical protein
VSRRVVVLVGLVAVVAFALLGRTAAQTRHPAPAAQVRPASTHSAPAGGGGLPVGAPQRGKTGHGRATVTGALNRTFRFTSTSCVHSPNSAAGILVRGSTSLAAGIPDTLAVSTDATTDARIVLQLSSGAAWSDQRVGAAPVIRRTGKTITFSGRLIPQAGSAGRTVTITGTLTCTTILTLG